MRYFTSLEWWFNEIQTKDSVICAVSLDEEETSLNISTIVNFKYYFSHV